MANDFINLSRGKKRELKWVREAREDRLPLWEGKVDDDLVLGYRYLSGKQDPIKLEQEARDQHFYVVGKSGYGKTNLLRNMILQDLKSGKGFGVLAPEAELITEEILPFVPDDRIDDVIYINPADTEHPVPFNPLALEGDEDIDLKVDENLTTFKRIVGETGHRMDEILRQTLYALVGRPGATLLDIPKLLDRTNHEFRREVIRTCRHEEVAHFWEKRYFELAKDSHLPITTRLGKFLHPESIRNILCNPEESLSFGKAMDKGKVMLFNLSDGLLGEQNSQILGQLVVSKFQLAVMARVRQRKAQRRPFFLYLDEFHTFTGTAEVSYEKMLSRARKYRLGLVLAHQQSGQIPTNLFREITGTVSTIVCFQLSADDARRFSRELVIEREDGIGNVGENELLRLNKGEAWCKKGRNTFFLRTYLAPEHGSRSRAEYIIRRAQRNYGKRGIPTSSRNTAPIDVDAARAGESDDDLPYEA